MGEMDINLHGFVRSIVGAVAPNVPLRLDAPVDSSTQLSNKQSHQLSSVSRCAPLVRALTAAS